MIINIKKIPPKPLNNLKISFHLPVRHFPGELPPFPLACPGEVVYKFFSKKLRCQGRALHSLRCLPEIAGQYAPALVRITAAERSRNVQLQSIADTIQS